VEPVAYHQNTVFEAALIFARTEGIVVAPEAAHAVRATINEALRCKEENKEECIVFNLSGHGHFDLSSYEAYMDGKLEDYEYPDHAIEEALKSVPVV